MKNTISIVYPGLKQDSEGKFTETKITLTDNNEFIGLKMPVSDNLNDNIRERRRVNYITF